MLNASLSGILPATPGISNGVTSIGAFTTNYKNLVKAIKAIPSIKGGVLIGVVNTTNVPILFPACGSVQPGGEGRLRCGGRSDDRARSDDLHADNHVTDQLSSSRARYALASIRRTIACEALPGAVCAGR